MIHTVTRALAILSLLVVSATAHGQSESARKEKASALYAEGNTAYKAGKWDEAAELFTKAYESYPAPAFLFNIGQAKRQGGHCQEAVDNYERFLAAKPDASNRAEVEGFIAGLEICARREAEAEARAQAEREAAQAEADPEPEPPEVAEAAAGEPALGDSDASIAAPAPQSRTRPRLLVAQLAAGPAFLGIGELDTNTRLTVAGGVGYPIAVGPAVVDVGVHASYTPLPWESATDSGTATLTTVAANGGVSMPVAGALSLRGELGAGALFFSAPGESVFVEPGSMATGTLTMLHLRAALGAHYALTDTLELHAQPVVFGYSPAKDGLRADIEAIIGYQVLLGVGYRM